MKAEENSQGKHPDLPGQSRSSASAQKSREPVAAELEPKYRNADRSQAPDSSYQSRRGVLSDILVMATISVVALSLSAALHFEMKIGFVVAISVGIAVFAAMLVGHMLVRRFLIDADRGIQQSQQGRTFRTSHELELQLNRIDELAEGLKELKSQISESVAQDIFEARDRQMQRLANDVSRIEEQLKNLRSSFHKNGKDQRQYVRSELQIVENLVKQIAESLTERNILNLSNIQSDVNNSTETGNSSVPPPVSTPPPLAGQSNSGQSETNSRNMAGTRPNLLEVVRESIATNKIDLYLQPVVSLPDQNVRYYEVLTRLRTVSNETMLPASYMPVAEQAGLMPLIDNVMLFRSVQIMSRLVEREPARGLLCNISSHSLLDPEFFPEFIDFMEQHAGYAGSLFFEFGQSMLKNCSPVELEGLTTLSELGFRFSMDGVTDLDIDFTEIQKLGFRFLKVNASVLLHGMAEAGSRIHAADMKDYLKRYGLDLIVQKIEVESQLSELLKFEVDLGQGFLFAEPRPVRPEIFGISRKESSADKAA